MKNNRDLFLSLFCSTSRPNGSTPDYSNVKPRVNFPKGLYKPPKSRLCSQRESLSTTGSNSSHGRVKQVGPNMPDVPSAPEVQELGCPKEATRLLSQLEVRFQPGRMINKGMSCSLPKLSVFALLRLPFVMSDRLVVSAGELQQTVDQVRGGREHH